MSEALDVDGTVARPVRRRRRSASWWSEVLSRWRASGLSAAAFCRGQGLSAASFYRWRHKLDGEPVAGTRPVAGFVRLRTGEASREPGGRDAQMPVTDEQPLRLRFPGGLLLEVPGDRMAELVALLCAAGGDDASV